MITSFNNNEDKVYLLLKDNVGRSRIRSRAKSHDLGSCDYGVIISNFFFNAIAYSKNMSQITNFELS